jgi:hypothetical protein
MEDGRVLCVKESESYSPTKGGSQVVVSVFNNCKNYLCRINVAPAANSVYRQANLTISSIPLS